MLFFRAKLLKLMATMPLQIGFGTVKEKNVTKPMKGHFAKAGVEPVKFIRELRLADVPEYKAGDSIMR